MKIIAFVGLAAGILVLGAGWILSGAPMPGIPPARTPPPAGFEAADYPEFTSVASTDRARVINLHDFGQPLEQYHLSDLDVTYFMLTTEADESRIVFIDGKGALIGDITDQPGLYPLGPFMVTADAYYAVSASGVSDRRAMETLSQTSNDELERIIERSPYYRSFQPDDLPVDGPERAAGLTVHVIYNGDAWIRATTSDLAYRSWKGADFDDLETVYDVSRPETSGAAGNFFGGRYRVELTHFDQQEYLPSRGAPMGSTTGTGRPAQWVGTGYYTVFIDNAPALRFRIDDDREILSGGGPSQLSVGGGASLDFLTITHIDNKGWRHVIVVSGNRGRSVREN